MVARTLRIVAATAVLFGLWLALVDTVRTMELLVGGVSALAAAVWLEAARVFGGVRFAPRARWLARTPAAAWWIVRDSAIVLTAMLRGRTSGRFVALPFESGGDDGRAQARRALAFGVGSAGPNSYGIGAAEGALAAHELVPRGEIAAARLVQEP